jgi:hypothetical protein
MRDKSIERDAKVKKRTGISQKGDQGSYRTADQSISKQASKEGKDRIKQASKLYSA